MHKVLPKSARYFLAALHVCFNAIMADRAAPSWACDGCLGAPRNGQQYTRDPRTASQRVPGGN